MNDKALFRVEASRHAAARLGSPAGLFGVRSWITVSFIVAMGSSALCFVTVAKYTRKETVVGLVLPKDGVERISATKSGVIKTVLAKSGGFAKRDHPLFLLSNDPLLPTGGSLSSRLSEISESQDQSMQLQGEYQRQQIRQSRIETEQRLAGLMAEMSKLKAQQLIQIDRVALLEKDYNAAKVLISKQFISEVQLAQKEDALLQSRQSLLQVEQSLEQAESQITQLQTQIRAAEFARSESAENSRYNHAQLIEKRLSYQAADGAQVVSHKDGIVTNVQVKEGDFVTEGQTLALVVPDGKSGTKEVNLWVPSRAIGFVRAGDKVRLMFDAFPYQTFGIGTGRVLDVSSAPLMPNELPVPIQTTEQLYKIVVALDRDELDAYGRKWALMPGMRLTADVVLEERSILSWLLDPLLAIKKRAAA